MSVIHLNSKNYHNYINETTNAIIDFSATWCGPCTRMHPLFVKVANFIQTINLTNQDNLNVEFLFFEVDVDESQNISEDYSISCMPTLILIKNGELVSRAEGFRSDQDILQMIGEHFDISKNDDESSNNKSNELPVKHSVKSNKQHKVLIK